MLTEVEALVALSAIPYLGSIKIRALIHHFGSAAAAYEASDEAIRKLPDFGPKILQGWCQRKTDSSWKENMRLAERLHAEIIPYTSSHYPKRLLEIADHPVLLYVKGKITPADQRSIAVVGTRRASIYGKEMAEKISYDLAAAGFTVVSGLARGIDTAAHCGALKGGRTIAVIGSGLADIYPQENGRLAEEIASKGALVSEFPMAASPDRQNFPQRNRIVAAMTMGTLLIEAPVKSGAMITMEKAAGYKRKLFAIPGRADYEECKGNHWLIKSGQARLVENAHDIMTSFDTLFGLTEPKARGAPLIPFEKDEQELLRQLPMHELSIDEIVALTKLPIMKINVLLMSLIMKKAVKEFAGKIYKKVGHA